MTRSGLPSLLLGLVLVVAHAAGAAAADLKPGDPTPKPSGPPPKKPEGDGWVSLFSGKDFAGWTRNKGGEGQEGIKWKVTDGTIENDGTAGHTLWTEREFADFTLHVEWRFTRMSSRPYTAPIILPDGGLKQDADGKTIRVSFPNADSGIFVRGGPQINIWCWPCGSGELWSYRNNKNMPPEVRAAAAPDVKADHPPGQWNAFDITARGSVLTVVLNGKTVIEGADLPGLPPKGRIGLQNHGGVNPKTGESGSATSFIQFRNIWIKELKGGEGGDREGKAQ